MTKVELYKSRLFVTIIHLSALSQFAYGLYFHKFPMKLQTVASRRMVPQGFAEKLNFLSYWSLIIQALYYIICLINDFFGTNEAASKNLPLIRKVKDYLLASLAFPIALNVGFSFWILYGIDRELVFPKALDAVFPGWLNHVMHTNIVVFIVLEMFTSFREYPSRKNCLTGLMAFMVCYLVWLHVVKHYSGIWVYPVLEVLQLPQRILFFVAILIFTLGLYYLGEFINSVIWEKELKLAHKKVK